MRKFVGALSAVCLAIGWVSSAGAAVVQKTVLPTDPYGGFMNVFELPANGGGYVFGSGWGTADLRASFTGPILKLQANNIGDPAPFWYQGGGAPGAPGNKIMAASMYVDTPAGVANGDTLVFSGTVLENTWTAGYGTIAFIKDFAADYSSFNVVSIPLTSTGAFSIQMDTLADPARHIQFGFETTGANAWVTDADAKGYLTVTAGVIVPEPVSVTVLGAASTLLVRRRRA